MPSHDLSRRGLVAETIARLKARLAAGATPQVAADEAGVSAARAIGHAKALDLLWPPEKIARLKTLWTDGYSASQIAAALGGCTRNAVIGKVHRLGLSGRAIVKRAPALGGAARVRLKAARPQARPPAPQRAALATALAPAMPHAAVETFADNVIPFGQRCSLMELKSVSCRWPVGDPQSPDFYFCGGLAIGPLPYCLHHARLAYVPAARRTAAG